MKAQSLVPLLLIATSLSACSSISKFDLCGVATGGRDGWQHPEAVIQALEIKPGDRVAEIGAGSGYWIQHLSEAVGPDGTVYAVEVTDDLVLELEQHVSILEVENVEVVRGEFSDPNLPANSIDLAITSLTYHHIDDRVPYFSNLRKSLSTRGRVAHLDDRDDLPVPIRWLPTKGHWSNVEAMNAEMTEAGFLRTQSFDILPMQSFQIFAPKAPSSTASARVETSEVR